MPRSHVINRVSWTGSNDINDLRKKKKGSRDKRLTCGLRTANVISVIVSSVLSKKHNNDMYTLPGYNEGDFVFSFQDQILTAQQINTIMRHETAANLNNNKYIFSDIGFMGVIQNIRAHDKQIKLNIYVNDIPTRALSSFSCNGGCFIELNYGLSQEDALKFINTVQRNESVDDFNFVNITIKKLLEIDVENNYSNMNFSIHNASSKLLSYNKKILYYQNGSPYFKNLT